MSLHGSRQLLRKGFQRHHKTNVTARFGTCDDGSRTIRELRWTAKPSNRQSKLATAGGCQHFIPLDLTRSKFLNNQFCLNHEWGSKPKKIKLTACLLVLGNSLFIGFRLKRFSSAHHLTPSTCIYPCIMRTFFMTFEAEKLRCGLYTEPFVSQALLIFINKRNNSRWLFPGLLL